MQPLKPDSRVFASYPMPAKIDLLNERPRRESQVELELENRIGQITPTVPQITVNRENLTTTNTTTVTTDGSSNLWEQQAHNWNGIPAVNGEGSNINNININNSIYSNNINSTQQSINDRARSPTGRSEFKETRITINRHSSPIVVKQYYDQENSFATSSTSNENMMQQQQQQRQQQQQQQQQQQIDELMIQGQSGGQRSPAMGQSAAGQPVETTTTTTTIKTTTTSDNKTILANELAEKEAKLMREIDALNQRPYSPYQTPGKIDLTNEQRVSMNQHQHQQSQYGSSPRPGSRASSSTGTDLLEKEAKLLKEIEEIESKPFNPQTMIVEREQWFEYPENRPHDRHLTDSKRRVRDFCSMPAQLCQDRHIHEENIPIRSQPSPTPSSIHTTIIRSPKREIDNKSPLPFAFDNFTTKGVRGNIASVGAVEPDRPRPPIYPIVKRTPSPGLMH